MGLKGLALVAGDAGLVAGAALTRGDVKTKQRMVHRLVQRRFISVDGR